ncbi:MAG: hypothetical protein Q4D98_14345 [Planctomycetia bacterium]|nr:hypothetical protein [Planctomycetia bacterium]
MRAVLFFAVVFCGMVAWGQSVQLPTFQNFGTQTTVTVPDGGRAVMGGVTRANEGGTSSGVPVLPFRNRSYGNSVEASGVSVTATVHDFEAMDEALLNSPSPRVPQAGRRGDTFLRPTDKTLRRVPEEKRSETVATRRVVEKRRPPEKLNDDLNLAQ